MSHLLTSSPLHLLALYALTGCVAAPPRTAASTLTLKAGRPLSRSGGDDVRRLQVLASGVGQDVNPNAQTGRFLRRVGIRTLRCINDDLLEGSFGPDGEFRIKKAARLDAALKTCRQVGAVPHVVIAQLLPPGLKVRLSGRAGRPGPALGGNPGIEMYGPTDWKKFRAYTRALFRRVMVTQGFSQARFEVGNEPDIGGTFVPAPPRPEPGSKALYAAYLNLYRNVASAAREFEAANPGLRVRLGGPALSLPFTFKHGDFNWTERFLKDAREQRLPLDFIGVHFYGNVASLRGEYDAPYPPFTAMMETVRAARDRYQPGVPVWLTEWGPSYHTDNSAEASVNASHVGAAWAADFLDLMLETGVDGALFLVTTDLALPQGKGWKNVWGWPSLFVNPVAAGKTVPKAPAHVFDMISRLRGERIEAGTEGASSVRCFASADPEGHTLTLLLWNYDYRIPEFGKGEERAREEEVTLRVEDAGRAFGDGAVRMEQWRVSATESNAYALHQRGQKLDARAGLQRVLTRSLRVDGDSLETRVAMPPSSVSLVRLSRE